MAASARLEVSVSDLRDGDGDGGDFDLGEGQASPVSLEQLVSLGKQFVDAEEGVSALEEALSAAKKELHHLKTNVIPDAMAEVGLDEFKLPDGSKVSVADFVSGSLPKDPERRANAIRWLEAHDASGLIKTEISLNFSRSQHNVALDVFEGLKKQQLEPVLESSVHAQTLQAFAREAIKNGNEIDTEVLGLFVGRAAKVKLAKK